MGSNEDSLRGLGSHFGSVGEDVRPRHPDLAGKPRADKQDTNDNEQNKRKNNIKIYTQNIQGFSEEKQNIILSEIDICDVSIYAITEISLNEKQEENLTRKFKKKSKSTYKQKKRNISRKWDCCIH